MRQTIPINNDWEFTPEWTDEFLSGGGEAEAVRLPHTCPVPVLLVTPPQEGAQESGE